MSQATGRVTVKMDGKSLRSKPGASIKIGGYERPGEMTDQNTFYYTEKATPSEVKCTMPHMGDTDLIEIRDFKDGTVTFSTDTGLVYTVANAVCKEIGELKNGEVEVTFMGDPAK